MGASWATQQTTQLFCNSLTRFCNTQQSINTGTNKFVSKLYQRTTYDNLKVVCGWNAGVIVSAVIINYTVPCPASKMTALGKDSLTSTTIPTLHTFKYLWLHLDPWPIEAPNLYITSQCNYVPSVMSTYLAAQRLPSIPFPQFHRMQSAVNNKRTREKKKI